jgi:hypothetical protein
MLQVYKSGNLIEKAQRMDVRQSASNIQQLTTPNHTRNQALFGE